MLSTFLLVFITNYGLASALTTREVARDTLFRDWSKNKSTLPYFFYELKNFEDPYQKVEVEGLVGSYGVGGIYLSNGDAVEVSEWINKLNNLTEVAPIIVAKIDKVFELPFTLPYEQSSQVQIESITSQNLLDELIRSHAIILKSMGIDVIHFEYLPKHYSSIEQDKVVVYIEELHAIGLKLSFGKGCKDYIDRIGWSNIDWIPKSLAISDHYKLKKKAEKYFFKETGYQGFVVGELDQVSFYSDKENQLNNGYDILTLPKELDPYLVINNLILAERNKKSLVKRSAKSYFEYWNANQSTGNSYNLAYEIIVLSELNHSIDLASITLLMDYQNEVPFRNLTNKQLYLFSNSKSISSFASFLGRYTSTQYFGLSYLQFPLDTILTVFQPNSTFIVDLSSVYHITDVDYNLNVLRQLNAYYDVVILYQGDRFNLSHFDIDIPVLWTPKMGENSLSLMLKSLFGVYEIQGGVPTYANPENAIQCFQRLALNRLTYDVTSLKEYNVEKFDEIDCVVSEGIQEQAFPGCQIMMVKGGEVVFDKSYGYLTYDSITPVQWNHIYDIASVTKTVATVPMVMNSVSNGQIQLSDHLGDRIDQYQLSDKSDLNIAKLLTHQSGLRSYIPFWRHASYSFDSSTFFYKKGRKSTDLLKINWSDSIHSWIAKSTYNSLKLDDNSYQYLYSDLGFMVMKELLEETNLTSLDHLTDSLLYGPMGMNFTMYNPLDKFDSLQIVPTSLESSFRSTLLRGQVHDKNAALLGGVSGHAGLFSNANDLAKYMQMMLQKGVYGGHTYFDSTLVNQFTAKFDDTSLRGLGWDKPRMMVGNVSKYASEEAFGHSGFTGALVWADPKYDLVYIFLSNRVYPDPENSKLMELNIRTRIHDLMYESFLLKDNVVNEHSSGHF